MTLGYALVAAFVFLAWLTDRRFLLWPALLLGIGFASGLSLSGHSAVDPGSSWRSEVADWAHLSAAALWIGGLVQLAFVVWPKAPALRRTAFLRLSRMASGLIAIVLGAGDRCGLCYLLRPHPDVAPKSPTRLKRSQEGLRLKANKGLNVTAFGPNCID